MESVIDNPKGVDTIGHSLPSIDRYSLLKPYSGSMAEACLGRIFVEIPRFKPGDRPDAAIGISSNKRWEVLRIGQFRPLPPPSFFACEIVRHRRQRAYY
jgi:hypothetical protein